MDANTQAGRRNGVPVTLDELARGRGAFRKTFFEFVICFFFLDFFFS
jgi:hypothetical protein